MRSSSKVDEPPVLAPVAARRWWRRRPPGAPRPTLRLTSTGTILVFFVALTSTAIVAQTWWAIAQDRRLTLASEQENGLLAVRLLEEHARQQLAMAAARLDTVANGVGALEDGSAFDDQAVHDVINSTLKNSRAAGALQFINLRAKRWASPIDFPSYVFDAEERGFIAVLLTAPDNKAVLVGHPFQRFIDGEQVVPLARNLYDHDGMHVGVLSTEVTVRNFNAVYQLIAKNSNALVQLVAERGFMIVSSATDTRTASLDSTAPALLKSLPSNSVEGSFAGLAEDPGRRPWLYTYRRVADFPVTTVYGRDLDQILTNWSTRTWDRVFFSGVFIVFQLLLTFYLLLHMRKLHHSQTMLRSSEARFVDLFQRSPVPLALIRIDNDQLTEANDALLTQFGYQREQFVGTTPQQLALWCDPDARAPYVMQLKAHTRVDRYEARLRHQDGHAITCLLSTRIIESNGQQVAIFSPIDVSRQREVEDEIRRLNAQLEQRVGERTASLQGALDTLQNMQGELVRTEKMAALGSLVAGVAHELNTPLGNSVTVASTITLHLQTLYDELRAERPRRSLLDQSVAAMIKGADILSRNLQRAATLVSSFKQVAVDQSGNQRRRFDLKVVIEEIMLTLEPMYKKSARLTADLASDIVMDSYPGALAQILTNCVSNAIAHGFDGRESGSMHVRARAHGTDQIDIVFSDDGIGIAPEHIGRVFDPFFTTKLGQGGSGLGMHIVYNLVTGVLGGQITLDSKPGHGTRVSLTLPLAPRETPDLPH